MIKRYSASILGAFTITFLLFLGMNILIAPGAAERVEIKQHGPIVIGRVEDSTPPPVKIRQPEKIIDEVEPIKWTKPTQKETAPDTITIGIRPNPVPTDRVVPTALGLSEGDIQPLRKFAPTYPRALASRGVEGYVIVQFTVNKMGAVENVIIVESTNRAFERPSIRAVEKYKYKPRVIDGVSVEVQGVMEKISFEIEES